MPAERRRFASPVIALAALTLFAGATVFGLQRRTPQAHAVRLYLVPGAGTDDMVEVYTTVLGTANRGNHGFTLHDGIAGVRLEGNVAQTILIVRFREDLGRARRAQLIADFQRSPIVSRVEPAAP